MAGAIAALADPRPAAAEKIAKIAPVSVAVIDFQGVMRASVAARSIRSQITARKSTYRKEFDEREKQLHQQGQGLARQRGILAPDAFEARRQEFGRQVAQAQKDVQARNKELDNAYTSAMNQVRNALIKVVADLAKEAGVGMVLFKNQVVIVEKALDFSEVALKRLDAALKDVKVELPQG